MTRLPWPLRALVAGAAGLLALTLGVRSQAGAVEIGGLVPFGITPGPSGSQSGYFQLALSPGATSRQSVAVSNAGTTQETLRLGASTGATAPNSGTSFETHFGSCSGVACWLSGLPPTVTLAAGASAIIPFDLSVPLDAAPKQYLAGITAEPATPAPPVVVGGNDHSAAKAIIVRQASVGVAVSVGSPLQLSTQLRIPNVTAVLVGQVSRLQIQVDNNGQTFVHGSGSASCNSGSTPGSYMVTLSTVLPGDQATVPVNAPGITPGSSVSCRVQIQYGNGLVATWSGSVDIPTTPPTTIVHTGPGTYSVISTGIPGWAVALIVIGALVLVAIGALILAVWRRGTGAPTSGSPTDVDPSGGEEHERAATPASPG